MKNKQRNRHRLPARGCLNPCSAEARLSPTPESTIPMQHLGLCTPALVPQGQPWTGLSHGLPCSSLALLTHSTNSCSCLSGIYGKYIKLSIPSILFCILGISAQLVTINFIEHFISLFTLSLLPSIIQGAIPPLSPSCTLLEPCLRFSPQHPLQGLGTSATPGLPPT